MAGEGERERNNKSTQRSVLITTISIVLSSRDLLYRRVQVMGLSVFTWSTSRCLVVETRKVVRRNRALSMRCNVSRRLRSWSGYICTWASPGNLSRKGITKSKTKNYIKTNSLLFSNYKIRQTYMSFFVCF